MVVIDPRNEYREGWPADVPAMLSAEMPDDAIVRLAPDANTAILALSHDPRLDDMGLIEALKTNAFYVGAMGSLRTTIARKERLALFDLTAAQIERLRGPAGLDLGSRTPPEIAVAIAAELVLVFRSAETLRRRSAALTCRDPRSLAGVVPVQRLNQMDARFVA